MAIDHDKYPHALPEGTVLAGQYIVESVLGEGGFGITYEAFDHKTKERVAVKEYFPDTMAARTGGTRVTPYSGARGENFEYGKECFLQEARTLAEFIGNENIVRIFSYFEENGTAYFAMEYVEGTGFDRYIAGHGGKLSFAEICRILFPVMDALNAVHEKGIIHRDISPDNIYITSDGGIRLLDFGAARYSLGDRSCSLDVVLKPGYAPKEQYTRRGRQGPYTDIYALGATFYFSLTGKKPLSSIDRLEEDDLLRPSVLGADIGPAGEQALLQALELNAGDRYQSMTEFKQALIEAEAADQAEEAAVEEHALQKTVTEMLPVVADSPEAEADRRPASVSEETAVTEKEHSHIPNASEEHDTDAGEGHKVAATTGAEKKKGSTGLVIVLAALALIIVGVIVFVIARSPSHDKQDREQPELAEAETPTPKAAKEKTPTPTPESVWTGAVNWRGGDWTNRDDILPYKNEEGYIVFGAYEQDGDESNGPEPIEWEVLEENENGTFLVSRYVLDAQPYNTEQTNVTWESCTLRGWLNNEFLNHAFTQTEQGLINTTNVANPDNPKYGTPGGNSTSDRIFLLSADEVISHYSFNSWYEKYQWGYSQELIIPPTAYAKQQGVSNIIINEDYYNNLGLASHNYSRDCIGREGAWWWLRSPGYYSNDACFVRYNGRAGWDTYYYVVDAYEGLRPALHLEQ
ncbi:MAG: serine/threonine protein kinase [Lachnospiraceae bacterium]|nr:serine/threonine protein kinase [Lachnospiraceae bacterium]